MSLWDHRRTTTAACRLMLGAFSSHITTGVGGSRKRRKKEESEEREEREKGRKSEKREREREVREGRVSEEGNEMKKKETYKKQALCGQLFPSVLFPSLLSTQSTGLVSSLVWVACLCGRHSITAVLGSARKCEFFAQLIKG